MKNRIVGVCVTTFVVLSLVALAVFVTLPSARAVAQFSEDRLASSPTCADMSGVWHLGSTGIVTITQSGCQATGLAVEYWRGVRGVLQLDCTINGYAVTGFWDFISEYCLGARWEITGTISPSGESFTLYNYPIRDGANGTCTALFSITTGTKVVSSLEISYLDAVQVVDGQDIPLVKGKDTAIKVRVKNTGTTAAHNVRVAVTANGVSQGTVTRNRFYREERASAQTGFIFTGDPEDHLDTLNAGEEKTLYFFDDNGALNPTGVENATSWYTVSASTTCDEGAADTEQLTKEVVTTKWGSNYPEELRVAYLVGDWPAPRIISPISGAEVSTQAELIKESQKYLGANFPLSASSLGLSLVFDNASSKDFDLDGDGRFNTEELFRWGEDIWLRVGREYPKVDRVVCLLPPGWVCRNAHTPFPCWSWPFDLASGIVPVWGGEWTAPQI